MPVLLISSDLNAGGAATVASEILGRPVYVSTCFGSQKVVGFDPAEIYVVRRRPGVTWREDPYTQMATDETRFLAQGHVAVFVPRPKKPDRNQLSCALAARVLRSLGTLAPAVTVASAPGGPAPSLAYVIIRPLVPWRGADDAGRVERRSSRTQG